MGTKPGGVDGVGGAAQAVKSSARASRLSCWAWAKGDRAVAVVVGAFIALIRSWRAAVMVLVADAVGIRTRDGNQLSVSATRWAAVSHAQTRKQR